MSIYIRVLLILVFYNFTWINFAQENPALPITLNSNVLPVSSDLPTEFLLLVPDSTTQILFNPARAYNYNKNFLYSVYQQIINDAIFFPISQRSPTVSINQGSLIERSSLFSQDYFRNSRKRRPSHYPYRGGKLITIATLINFYNYKWLIQFSNRINNRDEQNENIEEDYSWNTKSFYIKENENLSENFSNRELENHYTSLKISLIDSSYIGKYSLGFLALIDRYKPNSNFTYISNSSGSSEIDTLLKNTYSDKYSNGNYIHDYSNYLLGFEFTITGASWDYIGNFNYQYNRSSSTGQYNNHDSYIDSLNNKLQNIVTWRGRMINYNSSFNIKNNPSTFSFNNFFQQKVNWINNNDNIFIRFNSYYSNDLANQYLSIFQTTKHIHYEYPEYIDTSRITLSESAKLDNWGILLSVGYSIFKDFGDIYSFTGIKLNSIYQHSNFIQGQSYLQNTEFYNKLVSLTIPIYLSYRVQDWLKFFGGFRIEYTYLNMETKIKANFYSTSDSHLYSSYGSRDGIITETYSKSSFYFGTNLSHDSGIKLQIDFKGSFTQYNNWNMALGYHF